MELAEIYELESLRCQAELEGNEEKIQQVRQELFLKMQQDPRTVFPDSQAISDVFKTEISEKVIAAVSLTNLNEVSVEIDQRENEYRLYVEELLNVNLSKVRIARVKDGCKHAEGSALPCGATDHMILLPPIGADFVSPDLLIHELGHAAEFTLRRASNDIEMIRSHRLFSEAIAHYCQYKYLLEFGTEAQRIGAIGSVTKDHLLLRALRANHNLSDSPKVLHVSRIIDHEYLDEYRAVYSREKLMDLLADYDRQPFVILYFMIAEARMGAVLALHLINNGGAIRELCLMKTDGAVRGMLDRLNLNTDELMDFSKADELIRKFIGGV